MPVGWGLISKTAFENMDSQPSSDVSSSRLSSALNRLSAALAARIAVDRRALAAFRIGLGLLLLADLVGRSRWLTAFYLFTRRESRRLRRA
jgi:hypothetical protein